MSNKSLQPLLKGFQCMAVYDQPQVITENDETHTKKKKSKKDTSDSSPTTTSAAHPLIRYLYYKSHSTTATAEDDGLKPGCTLFVVNIPFHYTSEHLTQLFNCFGSIEQAAFLQSGVVATTVQFDPTKIGAVEPSSFYRSAHIVYESEESVDMAVKTDLSRTPQPCPEEAEDDQNVGLKRWLSQYHSSHPQVASLQLQVDKFMEGFDARSAEEKAEARKGTTTDADGWTLVKGTTRGKKRQLMAMEEETERAQERATKKAKQNQIMHFYKHQEREQKKERLIALREKFEQDKAKITKMKQERKFKPY